MSETTQKKRRTAKNLPQHGGRVLAGVARDITIPHYSDLTALPLMDPTLTARGEALAVYRELLRDARVRATLNKRKSKVLRREWVVEPGGERPIDEQAAEGVREMIAALPFDAICRRLLDALLFGYAVAEVIWGRDARGRIAPVDIVARRPERFVFDKDWKPRLLTPEQPLRGIELPERKFIVHRFEAEDNNPYGLGLGSTLYWHVLFKREGVAFWMTFLEKFTSPTPVGKYPAGTPEVEVQRLVQALRDLVQAGVLAVPLGTELELLEAKRAGEAGYEAWCRYWDEQTAELVLGATLSTNVGSVGSKAAAEVHAEESEILADEDADQLSATLNDTLLKWITELNWPAAAPPTIWRPRPKNAQAEEETETIRAKRRQEELRAYQLLKQLGYAPEKPEETLAEVMDRPVVAAEAAPSSGVSETPDFAAADGDGAEDGAPDHLAAQLAELAGPLVDGWIETVRQRLERHRQNGGGWEGAANAALSAWPDMQVDPLGRIMGDALALAEMEGREQVNGQTGINPFTDRRKKKSAEKGLTTPLAHAAGDGAEPGAVSPFREAIEFLARKLHIPTQKWTDILHDAHDRAFVVAGAMKEGLLKDIHEAMLQGLRGELPFERWLERFDEIVARHGWRYRGGRDWRARVIYETNLRTARAAGRFKQMRHPDVLAAFPYWRYVHAFTRVPNEPREQHLAWDGLILPATDPWWQTYYPPNGWRCSCGVEPVTEAEMRREKGEPDTAPPIILRKVKDPHTGEMVDYPAGVDFGWAYAPGRTWADGIAPRMRTWNVTNFTGLLRKPDPEELPPLEVLAKPFTAEELPEGLSEEEYVQRFLAEFGADLDAPVRFTDVAGDSVVISADLFRDAGGNWKVGKRGRARLVLLLVETIKDPDEIWLSVEEKKSGDVVIDRRYIRFDPRTRMFVVFEWNWSTLTWEGVTAHVRQKVEEKRQGVLLYRRHE